MYYVYILKSEKFPEQTYVGFTTNIERRLVQHNTGLSIHTSKFMPWYIETFMCFRNRELAEKFEKYLKTGSGIAFMRKRFIK